MTAHLIEEPWTAAHLSRRPGPGLPGETIQEMHPPRAWQLLVRVPG
jgi:hypothetical protein